MNNNTNINNAPNNQSDNNHYNVIINQNSTYNQDNSINIMLDTGFPYFQNYNYQQNETETNKNNNQIYPVLLDQKQMIEQNDKNKENINIEKDSKEKIGTPPKKKHKKKSINSPKNKKNKKENDQENINSTNKIDYRYIKKCPIKEIISPYSNEVNEVNKENQLFWFATYDKLMKTKYLIKIFNYYNNKPFESHSDLNYNFKEKTLVIKDFEIYFYENSNRPFIRYVKGGTIYSKLYLLTLKQINQIFSYLNRIDYKINYDRLNYLQRKGTFEIINDNTNEVVLPYCLIYCLGKYMNINIYGFSNNIDFNIYSEETSFQKNQRISSCTVLNNENNKRHNYILSNDKRNTKLDNTNINRENFKLPNSKKIAKLIKIINLNYPDFSIDDIINYLIPDNKYMNSITKINEIKNIFFFKKSNQNKILLSSMVRDTIKGISIQTPKSLISSFCPAESIIENNSFKNSDLFQPVSKKYVIPIKDDYKFQTISTNEKDNNKNNPFIIYVCDNVQKINFTNDNQANNINNMNNNINNPNLQYINPPQQNNKNNIEINNNNYIDDMPYLQTDINQQGKRLSKTNKNNKNNINNQNNIIKNIHNQNNSDLINNNNIRKHNKKMIDRTKVKSGKIENENKINDNNMVSPGKPSGIKIQKISTDINTIRKKTKYERFSGVKKSENKIRESYKISRTNIPLGNLNHKIKQLNKSIDNPNDYMSQIRFTKTSDMKKRQNCKSNNKTKLINRINLNKKENPFFNKNNNYNSNL